MQSMTERRKHERFTLVVPAQLETASTEKTLLSVQTENIGAGGAFFRSSTLLMLGTAVKASLLLPLGAIKELQGADQVVISIAGIINRNEEGGMSMTFDKSFEILTTL
jgi:hypothetical protein